MDAIDLQNSANLFGIGLISLLVIIVTLYVSLSDHEVALEYTVPVPDECLPGWQGAVTEEPRLKVICTLSLEQPY